MGGSTRGLDTEGVELSNSLAEATELVDQSRVKFHECALEMIAALKNNKNFQYKHLIETAFTFPRASFFN